MSAAAAWRVERVRGDPHVLHDRDVLAEATRTVWVLEADRTALVLGSSQRDEIVDQHAVRQRGIGVVRRRSGGGAVLLVPGAVTWVDLVLPRRDPCWSDDVGHAFEWLGDAWARALAELGHAGVDVHRGTLRRTRWSDLVCFGGIGPGEVLVGGRKVVGISQRRTAAGARFQCAALHAWDPTALLDLLALAPEEREVAGAELAEVAAGIDDPAEAVVSALLATLPD